MERSVVEQKDPLETRVPGPEDIILEVEVGGGCSSLGVLGWWMLTMISHGVEISIAGGVVEMVRAPTPRRSFFFFLFLLISCVHCF